MTTHRPPAMPTIVTVPADAIPATDAAAIARLLAYANDHPHAVLGAHPATIGGAAGVVVRAFHPEATRVECLVGEQALPMERIRGGLFAVGLSGAAFPLTYRLRFHFATGERWERDDPYRFLPTLGDTDLHLFNEGTHYRLWEKLGAHPRTMDGVAGVSFAVWAPNARRVSVIGEFCSWDSRLLPMRRMGSSGVFELFVPGIADGDLYAFELLTREGMPRKKTDPFAFKMQQAPAWASIVAGLGTHDWHDDDWMVQRRTRTVVREPMLIYEVHLGAWARVAEDSDRFLGYAEIAPRLAAHVKKLGFTHIELLPVAEHPFYGSWGYQVSGYYAPTSRYGTPNDFRAFVDIMHQEGIGVILDWVPAHFPRDDYALRRFDGTALYEHEDPRLGEHPDWGTLIFNFGRAEVRNYLLANALYWLEEFHVDGLRVDAVASMLYLDYSRKPGEWLRNRHGGRENLEAIDFLRALNEVVGARQPGCFTIAEESTAWPGVTKSVAEGGLGFTFKWNMGWMHDTLKYFQSDPLFRSHLHNDLTFAMMYEYSERFILPLSHDEVVHLKGSLLHKMPGDEWQKFANLRLLLAYQYTRPGKKLLFMGTELAPWSEWNHDASLPWQLGDEPRRAAFARYMEELGQLYQSTPAFWRLDHEPDDFTWIVVNDSTNSVFAYMRAAGDERRIVVLNMTPVPRNDYRIGCVGGCEYEVVMSSDAERFGGSGYATSERVKTEAVPFHGFTDSLVLSLPPLGALILAPLEPERTES